MTIAVNINNHLYPIIPLIDSIRRFHGYTTIDSLTNYKLLRFKHFEIAIKRIKSIQQFYKKHKHSVFNNYEIVLVQIDSSINDTIIELKSKGIMIA